MIVRRAVVSLTFDDGLPCQIDYALPLLDKYGFRGTFFLLQDPKEFDTEFRTAVWAGAVYRGHEIGSHSVNHRKAATLTAADAKYETEVSKQFLQNQLATPVASFCYPFTDAPAPLQQAVQRAGYTQARGGRGARPDKYLVPGDGANLWNIPCFHAGPETIGNAGEWIDTVLERRAWLTLMFHGVGPDDTQWDNIHEKAFETFLSALADSRERGLRVVTFAQGAEFYRRGGHD